MWQGTHDHRPEAPNATAQVLGSFPHQVGMGSLLAGFLSFDICLGWHLQALPPRDPVWLWIVSILYTASSSRSAPSATVCCSLWSLGGQDITALTLLHISSWGTGLALGASSASRYSTFEQSPACSCSLFEVFCVLLMDFQEPCMAAFFLNLVPVS